MKIKKEKKRKNFFVFCFASHLVSTSLYHDAHGQLSNHGHRGPVGQLRLVGVVALVGPWQHAASDVGQRAVVVQSAPVGHVTPVRHVAPVGHSAFVTVVGCCGWQLGPVMHPTPVRHPGPVMHALPVGHVAPVVQPASVMQLAKVWH